MHWEVLADSHVCLGLEERSRGGGFRVVLGPERRDRWLEFVFTQVQVLPCVRSSVRSWEYIRPSMLSLPSPVSSEAVTPERRAPPVPCSSRFFVFFFSSLFLSSSRFSARGQSRGRGARPLGPGILF